VPSVPPDQSADWVVNVTLILRSTMAAQDPSMTISFPELNVDSGALTFSAIDGNATSTMVSASFKVPNGVPELWYPHNLGTPKRYNVTVSLTPWNTSFTTTTGFRTVVLVQSPYTDEEVASRGITPGDNFHFEINGSPFYSSGTNLIPFDPFYARINTDTVRWILQSAVAGGQNMVRRCLLYANRLSHLPDPNMGWRNVSTL
jgi:beta-mannosidase